MELGSGQVIRFRKRGRPLLIPMWFESNLYVRTILSQVPRGIERRLTYLAQFQDEEDGYDEEGNMLYYDLRWQLYESFLVQERLRRAMRNVLMRWRNGRMNQAFARCPPIDPITLCEPVQSVILYDHAMKKKFAFDAKSISLLIETNLLHEEGGFALPRMPRNPWNNVEFTYRQMVSLYLQLKRYGEVRWALSTLSAFQFDIPTWRQYHYSAITMKAIQRSLLSLDSQSGKELLEDFILMQLDRFLPTLTVALIHAYRAGIHHLPNHWYLAHWKRLAYQYYEAHHFHLNQFDAIEEECRSLYRVQFRFLRELRKRGLIPR